MSPFQAMYGCLPPHMAFPSTATTTIAVVETYMKERDAMLDILKESLHKAQERMKFYADKSRVDRVFAVGDMVYLNLQPYRKASVSLRNFFKLSAKFYGPFPVVQKIGSVAYKLQLPLDARIHPVFHVSQLKMPIGKTHIPSPSLPIVDHAGEIIMRPENILQSRTMPVGKQLHRQILIQWTNSCPEDATWEDLTSIRSHYLNFILEDKDIFQKRAMT
ncbi:uncharacterized protein LOC113360287 [Papaver somniferum]|uniref:uncharacterized protein LOC113360287 n=1 Tax=Papaver somniferum TaxID=3469 RepID=UPI000E6F4AE8|nr:uncharacterized protein LOC113360287 [Papaver somniferum]